MMKRPMAPKGAASTARRPAKPQSTVYMANGGYVKQAASMAGNSKSGTCGPGVSSRKK